MQNRTKHPDKDTRMSPRVLVSVLLTSALLLCTSCQSFPTVNTPSGPIKGVVVQTLDQNIVQYRNIPYAKPPVGDLRFKKPLPVEPWTETRDGTVFGPSCSQDQSILPELWEKAENKEISEDCLQLNVYVPEAASTQRPKPVMLWIHGGAFVIGNALGYNPSFFVLKDVIGVVINYRLGVFGFLSTGDETLPGNIGLWDMVEALKWVNKNIEAFGGDPKMVTVFGESAGGYAATYLASVPSNEGLFHRIIPQSGSATWQLSARSSPFNFAKKFGKHIGCVEENESHVDKNKLVECLKEKSVDDLLKAQTEISTPQSTLEFTPIIWPAADGELIRIDPYESLGDPTSKESAFFRSLDVLAGTTSKEESCPVFLPMMLMPLQESHEFNITDGMPTTVLCDEIAPAVAKLVFNDDSGVASDMICQEYRADCLEQQATNIGYLFADLYFVAPTVKLLSYHAKDNSVTNTYQYLYTQEIDFPFFLLPAMPWMKGAGHVEELLYMFGPKGLNELNESLTTDEGRAFTDVLVTYWTNFAKTGNPNGEGLVPWKPYSTEGRDYLDLNYESVARQNLYEKRMKFLYEDVPKKLNNNAKTEL